MCTLEEQHSTSDVRNYSEVRTTASVLTIRGIERGPMCALKESRLRVALFGIDSAILQAQIDSIRRDHLIAKFRALGPSRDLVLTSGRAAGPACI